MADYGKLPTNGTLKATPYRVSTCHRKVALNEMKQLVQLSKIGPVTWENQVTDPKDHRSFGIQRDWLIEAKNQWETNYDWRKIEAKLNSYPNFKAQIPTEDGAYTYDIHFIALISQKADAAPYLLLHGWPGSILEFLGVLDELMSAYTPENLPVHVILPSLPGYGLSSGPRLDGNTTLPDGCYIVDKLMTGLGFSGYIPQGGDVGAFMCRVLGAKMDAAKAVHLNYCLGADEVKDPKVSYDKYEQHGIKRTLDWIELGSAYAREHGTKPATIGLTLSASPISLLAWIGEKFIVWSHDTPPTEDILNGVSLYWLFDVFPRAIYAYRHFFGAEVTFFQNDPALYISKPVGYSHFPYELAAVPKNWVEKTCNLVWYKGHDTGGHFAALERPKLFTEDILDFAAKVWPTVQ